MAEEKKEATQEVAEKKDEKKDKFWQVRSSKKIFWIILLAVLVGCFATFVAEPLELYLSEYIW